MQYGGSAASSSCGARDRGRVTGLVTAPAGIPNVLGLSTSCICLGLTGPPSGHHLTTHATHCRHVCPHTAHNALPGGAPASPRGGHPGHGAALHHRHPVGAERGGRREGGACCTPPTPVFSTPRDSRGGAHGVPSGLMGWWGSDSDPRRGAPLQRVSNDMLHASTSTPRVHVRDS